MIRSTEQPVNPQQQASDLPRKLRRDLKTLVRFVDIYCRDHYGDDDRQPVTIKPVDLESLGVGDIKLCPACHRLLTHALVKRLHCPLDPKPACKHCEVHCYYPTYRDQIRTVMRYSGRRLVMTGRVDYLLHLLF